MSDVPPSDVPSQQQSIFESKVYRIPALIYERESETILAFAEERRSVHDHNAGKLVVRRGKVRKDTSNVKTIEWSELKPIEEARLPGHRTMNPCPLYDKNTGFLFVFFICVEGSVTEQEQIQNKRNKARLCYVTSTDLGQTWNPLTDLTDDLDEIKDWATFAVGPGHGLQTEQGRLIVPLYAYTSGMNTTCGLSGNIVPHALSLYSDNSGESWQFGQILKAKSIECIMEECFDEDGSSFIYCNARTTEQYREEHVSVSGGRVFRKMCGTPKLRETGNGCQGSVVSFPAQNDDAERDPSQNLKNWLLYSHPSHQSRRLDLGVYLNKTPSDASAWSKPWVINNGPSGYSDLAYIGDGWFACLMESGQVNETEQLTSVVFSYNDVKQGIK